MSAKPKFGASGGAWSVDAAIIPEVDVQAIRRAERVDRYNAPTQEAFAKRYGFTTSAVRDWELGRKTPSPTTRILLELIRSHPEVVRQALGVAEGPPSRPCARPGDVAHERGPAAAAMDDATPTVHLTEDVLQAGTLAAEAEGCTRPRRVARAAFLAMAAEAQVRVTAPD